MSTLASVDLSTRETSAWFNEAKLGLFADWGPAAIPAFAPLTSGLLDAIAAEDDPARKFVKALRRSPHAAMYRNTMAIEGSATARHHAETYGDLPYDAFVDRFRDEIIPQCDPEPWADLFARAGARYVVMAAKLPDGFTLWPSSHRNPNKQRWHSERDVVGEVMTAVRARGMRCGVYYSGGWDWSFGGVPMTRIGSGTTVLHMPDYAAYAEGQWRELIDRYEPSILWNDIGYPAAGDLAGLLRYYFERVPDGVVNNRFEAPAADGEPREAATAEEMKHFPLVLPISKPSKVYSDFVTPEYSSAGTPDAKWEAIRGLATSFGYNREESDDEHLSATELIHLLVDVVARGGNLLLDVCPTAIGQIPWVKAQRLLDLGWWLRVNGDAIYGTHPWQRAIGVTTDGLGVRFTASKDAVHAVVLGTPRTQFVEIDVRLTDGARVSLEGRNDSLPWTASSVGARITLPEVLDRQPAWSLRMAPAHAVHTFDESR